MKVRGHFRGQGVIAVSAKVTNVKAELRAQRRTRR